MAKMEIGPQDVVQHKFEFSEVRNVPQSFSSSLAKNPALKGEYEKGQTC